MTIITLSRPAFETLYKKVIPERLQGDKPANVQSLWLRSTGFWLYDTRPFVQSLNDEEEEDSELGDFVAIFRPECKHTFACSKCGETKA